MPTVTARLDDDIAEVLKALGSLGIDGWESQSDVFRAAVKHFIANIDMEELRAFVEKQHVEQLAALERFAKMGALLPQPPDTN